MNKDSFIELENSKPWVQYLYVKYRVIPEKIGLSRTDELTIDELESMCTDYGLEAMEDWTYPKARAFARRFGVPVIFVIK